MDNFKLSSLLSWILFLIPCSLCKPRFGFSLFTFLLSFSSKSQEQPWFHGTSDWALGKRYQEVPQNRRPAWCIRWEDDHILCVLKILLMCLPVKCIIFQNPYATLILCIFYISGLQTSSQECLPQSNQLLPFWACFSSSPHHIVQWQIVPVCL